MLNYKSSPRPIATPFQKEPLPSNKKEWKSDETTFRSSYYFALGRSISSYRSSTVFASCLQSFAQYAQTFRFLREKQAVVFLSVIFTSFKCPWQESNLHFSLRRAVSYPLNDKGVKIYFIHPDASVGEPTEASALNDKGVIRISKLGR